MQAKNIIPEALRVKLPGILYKYRDLNNPMHFQTLEEQTIFLPSADKFNDPFDCKIPVDYESVADSVEMQTALLRKIFLMYEGEHAELNEKVDAVVKKGLLGDKEYLRKHQQNQVDKLNEDIGIFCLSEEPDNLLLWSHYGNCHTGFCIGFNAGLLIDACGFSAAGPVAYFFDYPSLSVLGDVNDNFDTQVYNKSIHWQYEKDFRYIKLGASNAVLKFPMEAVKEIWLGCVASAENTKRVEKIRADKYPHAKLIKLIKSKTSYALQTEEIG